MHQKRHLKNENNNNQCTYENAITDAVNQQVLSFNVYLIAILYTDTLSRAHTHTHIHAHAKYYTFIFQTENIATIPYAEDGIHSTDTQTHKHTQERVHTYTCKMCLPTKNLIWSSFILNEVIYIQAVMLLKVRSHSLIRAHTHIHIHICRYILFFLPAHMQRIYIRYV